MRDLKFGIEIEFFGANYITVIEKLRANGIAVADFQGYTHQVIPQWKITTDSSVTSRGTGLVYGLELVSPILYGDEGLDELEKVYTVLNECGAKVDKSCGTHVHFDIADFSTDNVKSFLNLYYKFEKVLDYLLPQSRRNNQYCRPLTLSDINDINSDRCNSIRRIYMELMTRYKKVNLASYVKYGTIEIRHHGGTTEFEKMEAWIILMYQMLNLAKENNIRVSSRISNTERSLNSLLEQTNLQGTYTAEYLTNRYRHFKEVA